VFKSIVLALSSFWLMGCSAVSLQLVNLPVKFSDTRVIKNQVFGPNAWQTLDVYIPAQKSKSQQIQSYPVVVFFYGGGWTEGSKEMYAFVGDQLAKQGYVTVIADYRKYPEVKYPAFVEDSAQAVAWVSQHISAYQGDVDHMFLMGHSAGAHTAAMLATHPRFLSEVGVDPLSLKGVVGLAGPYDFEPNTDELKAIFSAVSGWDEMQVTSFVKGNEPPMLLLWGDEDTLVWRSNLDRLQAGINQQGGRVETKIYSGLDHVDMVSSFTWIFQHKRAVVDDVTRFLNAQVKSAE